MKKLMLSAIVAVFALSGLKAQSTGFEAGAYVGFPMGDAGDYSSFNFGINAAYYWTVAENFQAGVAAGYDHWIGKTVKETFMGETFEFDVDDLGFIPIAATAKYDFGGFFGGLDLGYAIGASKNNDGGFYYRPRVGWNNTSFNVYGFYKGISNDGSISSIGLGFDYKF